MQAGDRDKLVKAFGHMVDQVGEAIHEAENALAPTIDEMVHNAQAITRDVYTLTQEEAETLASALRRDLHKANQVLNRQRRELKDWLSFDIRLIEDRFIDLIANAADKAWLDFREFENEDHQATRYHSAEVCNAGTFSCDACGNRLQLFEAGLLPTCPVCHHETFYRVIG